MGNYPNDKGRSLPEEMVLKIRALHLEGKSLRQIAKQCGVSYNTVARRLLAIQTPRPVVKIIPRESDECDCCGIKIIPNRHRNKGMKHKFCSRNCFFTWRKQDDIQSGKDDLRFLIQQLNEEIEKHD